jgi:hypothetical protein
LLSGFFVMTFRPAISAALLALFAAACQPAAAPVAEAPATPETAAAAETPAPAGPSQLAKFQAGQFEKLDLEPSRHSTAKLSMPRQAHSFAIAGKVGLQHLGEMVRAVRGRDAQPRELQKAFAGKDGQ